MHGLIRTGGSKERGKTARYASRPRFLESLSEREHEWDVPFDDLQTPVTQTGGQNLKVTI